MLRHTSRGVFEQLRGSYYDTLRLKAGETLSRFSMFIEPASGQKGLAETNMYASRCLPYSHFIVRRLRMEIVDGCPEDQANLRRCLVRLQLQWKNYWTGPASTLLLEDWLRKALRNIRKGKNRQVNRYLDRALLMSLGGLEPISVGPGEQILVELTAEPQFTVLEHLAVRFFVEGTEYKPIQ